MNYGFIIDNRKCIGCHACTVACKAEHGTPVGVNRTWVKYVEKGTFPTTRRAFTVHRCNHCADAPCVKICPVSALFVRSDGIVDFDTQRCIGCKACMQACPYESLHIDPDRRVSIKCNYCAHRIDRGLEPACVNVCPTGAILSGNLDDPASEISHTLSRQPVSLRKPEKGTRPKLFYIRGDTASLRPDAAPPQNVYVQVAQASGVGHLAPDGTNPGRRAPATPVEMDVGISTFTHHATARVAPATETAMRTHDIPRRGVIWDWEVTGYVWTKSVATGVIFLPLLLNFLGVMPLRLRLTLAMVVLSLLFLAATGWLLVRELAQPSRFLYVLFRPQWRSWLVRGAYLITVFGATTGLWLLMLLTGTGHDTAVRGVLVVLGVPVAVYTAFLFAQAKGRDLWQSPLLPVGALINSVMTGGALVLLLSLISDQGIQSGVLVSLQVAIVLHLLLVLAEFRLPHATTDTRIALAFMSRGPLRTPFWSSLLLGNVLPLALLWISTNGLLVLPACVLVLLFSLVKEHVWVRAPQLVPLS